MNELKEWAELVVIPDGLNLREPGSLHQKRITKKLMPMSKRTG